MWVWIDLWSSDAAVDALGHRTAYLLRPWAFRQVRTCLVPLKTRSVSSLPFSRVCSCECWSPAVSGTHPYRTINIPSQCWRLKETLSASHVSDWSFLLSVPSNMETAAWRTNWRHGSVCGCSDSNIFTLAAQMLLIAHVYVSYFHTCCFRASKRFGISVSSKWILVFLSSFSLKRSELSFCKDDLNFMSI